MQGKSILLVEDNDDDAELFERAAKNCGATVHRVSSTEQAIACIKKGGKPRLVFLDLMLPNVRGIHFLRWVRERVDSKCIPVIVLAGVVPQRTLQDLCALAANAVMVKPSRLEDLQEAISAACTFWLRFCVPPEEPDAESDALSA
jgi:CheY-like chemotaxis protein